MSRTPVCEPRAADQRLGRAGKELPWHLTPPSVLRRAFSLGDFPLSRDKGNSASFQLKRQSEHRNHGFAFQEPERAPWQGPGRDGPRGAR